MIFDMKPPPLGIASGAGEAASSRYDWDAVNGALVDGYLEVSRRRGQATRTKEALASSVHTLVGR